MSDKRYCVSLVECENGGGGVTPVPNLKVGVETQWPELRNGRVVYKKLVDCGMGRSSAGTWNTSSGVNAAEVLEIAVDTSHSQVVVTNGVIHTIPRIDPAILGNGWDAAIGPDRSSIYLYVGGNTVSAHFYVCLTYTKTADPVLPDGAQAFIGADGWYIKDADGLHPWDEMN